LTPPGRVCPLPAAVFFPFSRNIERQNQAPKCDPALIKAIARGRAWFEELATGRAQSLQDLARRDGITRRYIRRLVDLAFLSPQLVEAILQVLPASSHRVTWKAPLKHGAVSRFGSSFGCPSKRFSIGFSWKSEEGRDPPRRWSMPSSPKPRYVQVIHRGPPRSGDAG